MFVLGLLFASRCHSSACAASPPQTPIVSIIISGYYLDLLEHGRADGPGGYHYRRTIKDIILAIF
jgi:hypothetical protein